MLKNHNIFDNIIAEITPKGIGGVSGLRLSGKDVNFFCEKLFNIKITKIRYSYFFKTKYDDLILIYYKAPNSYTGEDSVEIFCHANPQIVSNIINAFIKNFDIRISGPGEFTKRAYLNSKMDLVQAESVIDIITQSSKKAISSKMHVLRGSLSTIFENIKKDLITFCVDGEMEIEFEEDSMFDYSAALIFINKVVNELNDLIIVYDRFEELAKSINVCIIGKPNVGKSTLFNLLIKENRALIDSVPGTTRDYIESKLSLGDYNISLIDTAGLRDNPSSSVEEMGINTTKHLIENALFLIEVTDEDEFVPLNENSIIIRNKSDLLNDSINPKFVYTSAISGTGISQVYDKIIERLDMYYSKFDEDKLLVTLRQKKLIFELIKVFNEIKVELEKEVGIDVISVFFSRAINVLDEILGVEINTEILDNLFSKFCIGK